MSTIPEPDITAAEAIYALLENPLTPYAERIAAEVIDVIHEVFTETIDLISREMVPYARTQLLEESVIYESVEVLDSDVIALNFQMDWRSGYIFCVSTVMTRIDVSPYIVLDRTECGPVDNYMLVLQLKA
jgi:hypothetical protein